VHRSDGYFFLLPQTDALGKRQLSIAEMIVGQGLALAYLDPKTLESGGRITRDELLNQLATAMGADALMRALNPQRRRPDERLMQRTVRQKVAEALRRLAQLGFVELLPDERLRLPPSLLRFAEPVKGLGSPAAALAQLLARGEISLVNPEHERDAEAGEGAELDAEADVESDAETEADADTDSADALLEAYAGPDPIAESDGADAELAAGTDTDAEPAHVAGAAFDFSDVAFDELPGEGEA
jgi:chromosome partition protein MukE